MVRASRAEVQAGPKSQSRPALATLQRSCPVAWGVKAYLATPPWPNRALPVELGGSPNRICSPSGSSDVEGRVRVTLSPRWRGPSSRSGRSVVGGVSPQRRRRVDISRPQCGLRDRPRPAQRSCRGKADRTGHEDRAGCVVAGTLHGVAPASRRSSSAGRGGSGSATDSTTYND